MGTLVAGECFHSFFKFSQTFTSVSNSIETRRKCFLFLLGSSPRKITKNEENLIVLFIIKTYILYTTQYTRHLNLNFFVNFLSSYRNSIINQSAHVFSLSYFLNNYNSPNVSLVISSLWKFDPHKLIWYQILVFFCFCCGLCSIQRFIDVQCKEDKRLKYNLF